MKHKAIFFPFLFCAMIPPFAAFRWNPAMPNFLPEEIQEAVHLDSPRENESKEDALRKNHIDITALAGRFSPPAPTVRVKQPIIERPGPPRNKPNPVEAADIMKPKTDERVYLGIIRDENNIAHIFHRDIKSGNLISVREEP